MSNEIYSTPQGERFEGAGFVPAVEALMFDPLFRLREEDASLEEVLSL